MNNNKGLRNTARGSNFNKFHHCYQETNFLDYLCITLILAKRFLQDYARAFATDSFLTFVTSIGSSIVLAASYLTMFSLFRYRFYFVFDEIAVTTITSSIICCEWFYKHLSTYLVTVVAVTGNNKLSLIFCNLSLI